MKMSEEKGLSAQRKKAVEAQLKGELGRQFPRKGGILRKRLRALRARPGGEHAERTLFAE